MNAHLLVTNEILSTGLWLPSIGSHALEQAPCFLPSRLVFPSHTSAYPDSESFIHLRISHTRT